MEYPVVVEENWVVIISLCNPPCSSQTQSAQTRGVENVRRSKYLWRGGWLKNNLESWLFHHIAICIWGSSRSFISHTLAQNYKCTPLAQTEPADSPAVPVLLLHTCRHQSKNSFCKLEAARSSSSQCVFLSLCLSWYFASLSSIFLQPLQTPTDSETEVAGLIKMKQAPESLLFQLRLKLQLWRKIILY